MINLGEAAKGVSREDLAVSLQESITKLNSQRANFEKISTIVIHVEPWSDQNGFLTPTLKVKRSSLDEAFGDQYLEWHENDETVIWV